MTRRDLSVDPNGVILTGGAYTDGGEVLRAYLRQLDQLRSTYYNCWGDDDLGQQFSEKFLDGLGTLERLVTGLGDSLDFAGKGLTGGGKAYAYAEDEATEAGEKLHTALLPLEQQPHYAAARRPVEEHALQQPGQAVRAFRRLATHAKPNDPNKPPEISLSGHTNPETGKEEKFVTIDGQEHRLRPVNTPEGDELITRDGAVRLVSAVNPETGERSFQKISFDGQAYEIEPVDGQARLLASRSVSVDAPAGVMTSPTLSKVEWATATVDGYPLADGFMLMEAKALPDGQVRLDTAAFESIVPLTSEHDALTAGGEPIQPDEGSELFIVKRDPDYGGIPAGAQPSYAEFLPDGTAYPYISELDTSEPVAYGLEPQQALAQAELTTPDGGVIGHEPGVQQFLVQDNPNPPDPTAPGYQPDLLEFSPDGHASRAS